MANENANPQSAARKKVKGRRGVKAQLMTIMCLLVAIPIAVSIIVSMIMTRKDGIQSAMEINDVQARFIEESIDNILNQNVQAIQTFAGAPSTIEFLEGKTSLASDLKKELQKIDENLADGNSTVLTGADGMQLVRSVGDNLVDISGREYFKKAMEGTVYVSDVQVSKTNGSRIVCIAAPVYDASQTKTIGIVHRNYDLSVFHDLLKNELVESKQEIILVDRAGSVIAHSGHEITADNPEDQSTSLFYTDSRGDKENGDYTTKMNGQTWMVSWAKEDHTGWVAASLRLQSVALAHVTQMIILLLILGIACVAAGLIVAFIVAKSYEGPVRVLNDSLADLSEGKFTEIKKYTDRKDEFGEMTNATNTVISKIKSVVMNIKGVMTELGESSSALAGNADQISQTVDDVSSAVEGIARGATDQAETVQKATDNINVLSDAIQDVANNAEGLASTATSMNDSSTSSAEALRSLAANMEAMMTAMADISEGMSATNTAVQGVNERVDGITSIASQTNLLALNASIEAARAGEAGKGFAVVAEEIGKLATESAQTAEEIRAEMAKLLKQSQNAMTKTAEVTEKSSDFNNVLNDTVSKINELIGGVGTTVDGVTTISGLSQESAASKTIIVDAMDSLSAISEENAASTEETSASMQELNATVNLLSDSAKGLNELAKKLEEDLEFFKV
ncbi:MAG: methyl-accepting chemotaxis protein [Lachnospiraceae bacterium]|nr:methyl-accepting chemotaxis protein [Lachnospiraceae bacterium]